jgi:hypothetical protein
MSTNFTATHTNPHFAEKPPANIRFTELGDVPLPRGLREQARGMSWDGFIAAYGHRTGPLRLGQWECTDSRRLGAQTRTYQATLAVGDRIGTARAAACGPIAALTAMLYERGIAVEMLRFHQLQMGTETVTFICGTDGARDEWAMAWATDATQSALRAMIACANRLAS